MTKFNQARAKQRADKVQDELFADTMDMISRERASIKLLDGKKGIAVQSANHAIKLVNEQLEREYDNMMKNTTSQEMMTLHEGIKTLIHGWQHSNEIDTELAKALHGPQNFSDYQDYIKHLVTLSRLETTVKVLGTFKP
ncbi:hypothetical protein RU86_GL001803 [Lactococcus piscium]|uniref:Uncharacterized protein n=1 Tax=Pseudolactococcus piscium TaxID=1364 RepID=A0A2A5RTU9_9LACT|nr:hypothetical protein [Lactococcus piscium]PCS03656.1 hypothetical protein RU86_GL001803 [Lactococcus piscium]